jgi:hypothetical protein
VLKETADVIIEKCIGKQLAHGTGYLTHRCNSYRKDEVAEFATLAALVIIYHSKNTEHYVKEKRSHTKKHFWLI